MLSGRFEHADDLRHIAIAFQIPAKDPDEAIRQPIGAPQRRGQGQEK